MAKTSDFTMKEVYDAFMEKYPKTDITYDLFMYITREFNLKLIGALLDGKTVKLGHNLGQLRVRRVQRNHEKPAVDWGATTIARKEHQNPDILVFFTDDYYYRFSWAKGKVKNISLYKWHPTKGMRKRLVHLLQTDPITKLNYGQ
jgi:hypothetical protein